MKQICVILLLSVTVITGMAAGAPAAEGYPTHVKLMPFTAISDVTVAERRLGMLPIAPAYDQGTAVDYGSDQLLSSEYIADDWSGGVYVLRGGLRLGRTGHYIRISRIAFHLASRQVRATVAGKRMLLATWRPQDTTARKYLRRGVYSIRLTAKVRQLIRKRTKNKTPIPPGLLGKFYLDVVTGIIPG
jgi:hypothetical protein